MTSYVGVLYWCRNSYAALAAGDQELSSVVHTCRAEGKASDSASEPLLSTSEADWEEKYELACEGALTKVYTSLAKVSENSGLAAGEIFVTSCRGHLFFAPGKTVLTILYPIISYIIFIIVRVILFCRD